jgi:hypothetical protein
MSQILNPEISEAKEKTYLQEIENLFSVLKENNKSIKSENKEIERLRKSNDKSFGKLKQAVESLQTY